MKKGNVTILASILIMALVAAGVGAGTMAWLSDKETSTGNTLTAGTLDLKVGGQDDHNVARVDIGPIKPGVTGGYTWVVTNAGNVEGWLDLTVKAITNAENPPGPESETDKADLGDLGAQLQMRLYGDKNNNCIFDDGDQPIYPVNPDVNTLNSMPGTYGPDGPGILGANPTYIRLEWFLPNLGNNNDVQGDSASFDIEFYLYQPHV